MLAGENLGVVSNTMWESSIIEAERSFVQILYKKCDKLWI